ncbi:MAG: acyl--CoA ligase, partial [FCB group bacterium]|nr:acyl--CoA ligase [FCB group bacterium]
FRNCPEFFEINYAVQKAGGIPVPMNYRFTPREITFQANHSDSVLFFVEDLWLEALQKARPNLPNIRHFICAGKNCPEDMTPYEELMTEYPAVDPEIEVGPEDICVICYTGGTTGRPKGVMLSYQAHVKMLEYMGRDLIFRLADMPMSDQKIYRLAELSPIPGTAFLIKFMRSPIGKYISNSGITHKMVSRLMAYIIANHRMIRFGPKGVIRIMTPSMPMFHVASYNLIIMAALTGQFTFIQPDMLHFDPAAVLKMIKAEKVNMLVNVPTGWKMLAEEPAIKDYDLKGVVFCGTGGGVNPASLKKKLLDHFPASIIMDIFGQTEMTPMTSLRLDADSSALKDRSVGKPLFEARIVDENDLDLPGGQIGEVIYRSDTMMKGYYKDEDKTSEVIKNGWLYSGDLGYFDEEGEIRVVERKKECISSGGEKIFPLEVEEIIDEHPKVKHSCVIGVPDEKWGSVVRAVVVLKAKEEASEKELIDWTRDKISSYKKPRSIIFAESLPVTPVGKIRRA